MFREASSDEKKLYPALSVEEIEDWMEHIPVFAVTDTNGAGVVLKPDDSTSGKLSFSSPPCEVSGLHPHIPPNVFSHCVPVVFYFFLNPLAANATLTQLTSANSEVDLKVSAFSLGKIWFKLLNSDPNMEVTLKSVSGDEATKTAKGVEYRLVPDTRDLLGARMLLTMTPEDSDKLKTGESMTPEMAQKAIDRAMNDAPKFKASFNEVPVFTIAQMRMQKQVEAGESGEPITLLPMYFSLQNMVGTWQQFMSQAGADMQGIEPAINLLSLHDLVAMMQKPSEIDFRNVVLVPPAPDAEGSAGSAASMTDADPMASMGGATLGDV